MTKIFSRSAIQYSRLRMRTPTKTAFHNIPTKSTCQSGKDRRGPSHTIGIGCRVRCRSGSICQAIGKDGRIHIRCAVVDSIQLCIKIVGYAFGCVDAVLKSSSFISCSITIHNPGRIDGCLQIVISQYGYFCSSSGYNQPPISLVKTCQI